MPLPKLPFEEDYIYSPEECLRVVFELNGSSHSCVKYLDHAGKHECHCGYRWEDKTRDETPE